MGTKIETLQSGKTSCRKCTVENIFIIESQMAVDDGEMEGELRKIVYLVVMQQIIISQG